MPLGRFAPFRQTRSDPRAPQPGARASARMARRGIQAFDGHPLAERSRAAARAPSRRLRGARRYRLSGTGTFAAILRDGIRLEGTYVQLVAVPARGTPGRAGFVIGRKAFSRAVERNRVRRVLRAVVAAARPGIERFDVIVRVKRGCPREEMASVAAETARLIAALTAQAGGRS